MGKDECRPVVVSRRIEAAASDIFEILGGPGRHLDLDGSGMLREGASNAVIAGLGGIFVMRMHNQALGDYEVSNHIVEYELNRRIGWEPELREQGHPEGAPIPVGNRPGQRWSFELAPAPRSTTVPVHLSWFVRLWTTATDGSKACRGPWCGSPSSARRASRPEGGRRGRPRVGC
jgi:hypothetical protein